VAVDPLEGTRLTSLGQPNAISVVAVAERGTLFFPGAAVYMDKIAGGAEVADAIDIEAPPSENVRRVAKAKGVRPEDVDVVVMTHLHRDHVGWNLTPQGGKYVPTFPKARYWMSKKDWDTSHQSDVQPTRYPNAPSCVWPLAELGLVEFMNGEHSITRELTAVPTPGHTPGHMSILVTSKGERALVLGDAAHSPVQVLEPDWVSRADMDPDLTRETRKALLDRLAREQILVAAGHFEAPGFGRIVRLEGRRYWRGL